MLLRQVCSLALKMKLPPLQVQQARCFAIAEKAPPTNIEKTINQITLLGRVGGDPQKRGTEEHPVVMFSLATHTNYKYESGEMMQKTDWHRVCIFKPYLRETVYKYLSKGQRVYVQGRLTYGELKNESGEPYTVTSIIADDVVFFNKTSDFSPRT